MENHNQHKRYRWYLQFDEITRLASSADECPPFVNEENKEAWRRYLNKVIKNHLKEEAMKTPEFKDVELRIREEKLLRINGMRNKRGCVRWSIIADRWSDRR